MTPEIAHHFLVLTYVTLASIVVVFGMRTFASARQSRRQSGLDSTIGDDLIEIKTRLTAVETMMREVG